MSAAKKDETKQPPHYRVLVGCDIGNGYHEPGDIITGIPPKQVPAWLDEGVVELVDPKDLD